MTISVNDKVISQKHVPSLSTDMWSRAKSNSISLGFYFHETSHMRSFAKIRPSREFPNLQYSIFKRHFGETYPMSPVGTTKYAVSTIFHELDHISATVYIRVTKYSNKR